MEGGREFQGSIILKEKELRKELTEHCGLKILKRWPRVTEEGGRVKKWSLSRKISLLKILKTLVRSTTSRLKVRGSRFKSEASAVTLEKLEKSFLMKRIARRWTESIRLTSSTEEGFQTTEAYSIMGRT